MRLKIRLNYSQNFTPKKRIKKTIKFIIIHYTGMKKESSAIKKLVSSNSKVSSHYFIKDSGEIGTFNLGNLKITIASLKTHEHTLIHL